jgi:hypothetical protein
MKKLSKIILILGSGLVLFSIAGASVATYPSYSVYYYSAASGLSLIVAALVSTIN